MRPLIEICCYNLSSCLVAQASGADRIEFCDNPAEGGTTPSYGAISLARKKLQVPLFPIIRARGGDFLYNDDEYLIMQQDVKTCKEIGCDGVVVGILNQDGSIDKKRSAKLVQIAYPMSVTFHRAFDRTRNLFDALEDIIDIGCERILTSGGMPTALEGTACISQLVKQANERIIIMPGAGIRSGNIENLVHSTRAEEFHSSASRHVTGSMQFLNLEMNENLYYTASDGEEVKRIVQLLHALNR
ncbi:MAG: copper homeostasis protein CutC [Chitinophagaceae bacterium]